MKRHKIIAFIFVCAFVFTAYGGDNVDKELSAKNGDTVKVALKTKDKKNFVKVKAPRDIAPNKTNWSKIKDLFM